MEPSQSVWMCARVLQVCRDALLVRERRLGQEVLVHTDKAACFRPGEWLMIRHLPQMTMSIPPQISALEITRPGCC